MLELDTLIRSMDIKHSELPPSLETSVQNTYFNSSSPPRPVFSCTSRSYLLLSASCKFPLNSYYHLRLRHKGKHATGITFLEHTQCNTDNKEIRENSRRTRFRGNKVTAIPVIT
ncbi:hypothetical protein SADUNF_Sadunf06G0164200 [Salix dunnii]|uniref:Uncharacterized protein n=1 Tax=Salix dunnii TaxID=1413687 RepID=A0A835K0J1_9ROSI|nr:hypothetical protein SADUNF_Sadunf06G0164200 [Salix dunnii]